MFSFVRQDWMRGTTTATLLGTTSIKEQILSYDKRERQQRLSPKSTFEDPLYLEEKQRIKMLYFWRRAGNFPGPRPLGISCCCWPGTNPKSAHSVVAIVWHHKDPKVFSLWAISFSNIRPLRIKECCAFLPPVDLFIPKTDSLIYASRCQQYSKYSLNVIDRFSNFKLNDV